MDSFHMNMHFAGKSVIVKVEDTDRSLLLDVINDLYDEAEKANMCLPKYPSLSYNYGKNSIILLDDKGLMEMFRRFENEKRIDIWIGATPNPSHVLTMARQLKDNSINNDESVTEPNIQSTIFSQVLSGSLNFDSAISRQKLQVRRNQVSVNGDVSVTQSILTDQRFKLPKATAKLKGVYVPKMKLSGNREEGSGTRIPRSAIVSYTHDEDNDSDERDGLYEPSDSDDVEEEESMIDLEEEDGCILSSLSSIDDGYVPFQTNEWIIDDEGECSRVYANGELFEEIEFGSIKLRPWMLFMDKEHFKGVLRDFCIQEGFFVVVLKADSKRYTAECATIDCDWRIHASVLPDMVTWAIKSITNTDHGCRGVKNHNPMANAPWVASKLMDDIRANPDISAKSLQDLLSIRYGLEMKSSTLYRMKDTALKVINGGHDESYKLLAKYCEMVKLTNPGSAAHCTWAYMDAPDRPLQFKSLFMAFDAQVKGFIAGCRGLIGVDGTHLKGHYGGVLLAAVALDANNELFPIAVGVVECENKDTWMKFFWQLKQLLKDSERSNWTIISDRQKGVEPALEVVWPEARRRYCARHLCSNFKKEYPGVLMHQLFWRVVNSTSEFTFKKALEKVAEVGGAGCARWLLDIGDKETWTKHCFDPDLATDENTSNFVESFNSTLGVHRGLPVLALLEGVRRIAMVRHVTRQQVAESWPDNGICPNVKKWLKEVRKSSRPCQAYFSRPGKYEIVDGRTQLSVSLTEKTCACGLWQISGIPCKHAVKAILAANRNINEYVSEWYSVRKYKEAYSLCINPIPDSEQWPSFDDIPTLEPPTLKRSIGRPCRNRRREPGEQRKGKRSTTVKCKKCNCFGHNTRTCKGGYTAKEKRQMLGKKTKSAFTSMEICTQASTSTKGTKRKTWT